MGLLQTDVVAIRPQETRIDPQPKQHLGFITSIPRTLGTRQCAGIGALAAGAAALGNCVEIIEPKFRVGSALADRFVFNQALRLRKAWRYDAVVGFDLDGFALNGQGRLARIACIQSVLAEAVRFERGARRVSLALQAQWEATHARRADLVITSSEHCKGRLQEIYGVRAPIAVVPPLIDLAEWRILLRSNPVDKPVGEFTALCVSGLMPGKRVALLLRAAHVLRRQIPDLRVRVVGGGPDQEQLLSLSRQLKLEKVVTWVGDASRAELAGEFNRADICCFPGIQQGSGIRFLEAMGAGKPIIAARTAHVSEIVRDGILVEPDSVEALADGIWWLWHDASLRSQIEQAQRTAVEDYEMLRVAKHFMRVITGVRASS